MNIDQLIVFFLHPWKNFHHAITFICLTLRVVNYWCFHHQSVKKSSEQRDKEVENLFVLIETRTEITFRGEKKETNNRWSFRSSNPLTAVKFTDRSLPILHQLHRSPYLRKRVRSGGCVAELIATRRSLSKLFSFARRNSTGISFRVASLATIATFSYFSTKIAPLVGLLEIFTPADDCVEFFLSPPQLVSKFKKVRTL